MGSDTSLRLINESCKPLLAGTPQLSSSEIASLLQEVPEWKLSDDGKSIGRTYTFSSYMDGVKLFALLAALSEQDQHHPDALVTWCKVTITLWTHTVSGLSRNDFIMAAKFDCAWNDFSKSVR